MDFPVPGEDVLGHPTLEEKGNFIYDHSLCPPEPAPSESIDDLRNTRKAIRGRCGIEAGSREDEGYESSGNCNRTSGGFQLPLGEGCDEGEELEQLETRRTQHGQRRTITSRSGADSREALRQTAIRIETKTVPAIPGWNAARDPTDWYMCTLKLLRQTNLSKNLFELYCLASRKDHKFTNVLTKHPRQYKKEIFTPDNLMKVEGQHCDSFTNGSGRGSDDVQERIRKFARTNWKTPGEISLLMGREQNSSRVSMGPSMSEGTGHTKTYSSGLKALWKNARSSDYHPGFSSPDLTWRSGLHTGYRPAPPSSVAGTESPCPLTYPINRDMMDSPFKVNSIDNPSNSKRVTISLKIKQKAGKKNSDKSDVSSIQTCLPRLKLTKRTNLVAPNGHPRTKPARRLGPLSDPGRRRDPPSKSNSLESSSPSADAINRVYRANQPHSSAHTRAASPEWPRDPNPSPEAEVAPPTRLPATRTTMTSRVTSHVVKLPDINDGRSVSTPDTVDTASLIDRLSAYSPTGHQRATPDPD